MSERDGDGQVLGWRGLIRARSVFGASWRDRILNVLSAALIVWLLIRIGIVVAASPMAANANNYDFVRHSACVGVWLHNVDDRPKNAASPDRVVSSVIFDGDRIPQACVASTDNAFPWIVSRLHRSDDVFALQQIGLLKAAFAIALLALMLCQPVAAPVRLAISASALLILGDINNLLFFNSLYLEASTVIFGLASIILVWLIFLRRSPPRVGYAIILAVVLLWFAFARQQYLPFALALATLAAFALFLRWRARLPAAILASSVAACIFGALYLEEHRSEHTENNARANIADTVLGAVLPAASDSTEALHALGLPRHCGRAIGMDWYTPGFQQESPCPEVFELSRIRLLALFARDPATFLTPMSQAIVSSRPIAGMPYVVQFERPEDSSRFRFRIVSATSLTSMLQSLPLTIYVGVLVLSMLAGPAGLIVFIWLQRQPPNEHDPVAPATLLAGLGGCLVFYSIFSSVFGDGYYELSRHAIGLAMGLGIQVAALSLLLAGIWWRRAGT